MRGAKRKEWTMENNTQEISIKGYPGLADSSPVVCLIFSAMCFVCFAWIMGWLGEGSSFGVGVAQLSVFVTYVLGGNNIIKQGNGFPGNLYLVFATFFGGVAGAANVAGSIATANGIEFSMVPMGWCFVAAGVFLILMVPLLLPVAGKRDVIMTFTGGFGVLCFGLTGIGVGPMILNTIGAYSLLITGFVGVFMGVVGMAAFLGKDITFGSKPFMSPKA